MMIIPVKYSDLFPGQVISLESILKQLNRQRTMEALTIMLYNHEDYEYIDGIIHKLLYGSDQQFIYSFLPNFNKLVKHDETQTILIKQQFFSIHTGLEILKTLFSLKTTTSSHPMPDLKERQLLFKAILLANEQLFEKTTTEITSFGNDKLNLAYDCVRIQLGYSDFEKSANILDIYTNSYKANALNDFCQENTSKKNYNILLKNYLANYHCKNMEEYIITLIHIFIYLSNNPVFYLNPHDKNYSHQSELMEAFATKFNTVVKLKQNQDYTNFRSKPLIRFDDQLRCYSKVFIVNKIFESFIFEFSSMNNSLKHETKIKDLICEFPLDFSEEYLFNKIMSTVYANHSCIKKTSTACREICNIGEPDYYVRVNNNIFIYEYKDIMIRGDFKQEMHTREDIDEWIESHLVYRQNKKGTSNSAVIQFVNKIEAIYKNKFPWDQNIPEDKTIYPVLVLSRSIFAIPGITYILNNKIKKELDARGLTHIKVKDLLLLDQDTLILFLDKFNSGELNISDIAEEYYSKIQKKSPLGITRENILANATYYSTSFSDFIMNEYFDDKQLNETKDKVISYAKTYLEKSS